MKPIWLLLGLLSLGIGIVGIVLPLIPTTGPLLVAAFAFARSSDRLHDWLMNHPRFGKFITDFREGRGIPLKTKVTAVIAMTLAFGYSIGWVVPGLPAKAAVAAIGVWAIWYVVSRPTVRVEGTSLP
jgi:uncharacterized membrane protein YbaN (DUF454 family)